MFGFVRCFLSSVTYFHALALVFLTLYSDFYLRRHGLCSRIEEADVYLHKKLAFCDLCYIYIYFTGRYDWISCWNCGRCVLYCNEVVWSTCFTWISCIPSSRNQQIVQVNPLVVYIPFLQISHLMRMIWLAQSRYAYMLSLIRIYLELQVAVSPLWIFTNELQENMRVV